MSDVMMQVTYHRPVGAFMTALARAPEAEWPQTVEGLVTLLAAYLNTYVLQGAVPLDTTVPSPDIAGLDLTRQDPVAAEFVPDVAGDAAPDALGTWRAHPFFEIAHVQRSATLDLCHHRPERVVIRLPEVHLLTQTEKEAKILSQAGDSDRLTGPSYYYDYMGGGSGNMTTMEYFWSRIADYTTASCR